MDGVCGPRYCGRRRHYGRRNFGRRLCEQRHYGRRHFGWRHCGRRRLCGRRCYGRRLCGRRTHLSVDGLSETRVLERADGDAEVHLAEAHLEQHDAAGQRLLQVHVARPHELRHRATLLRRRALPVNEPGCQGCIFFDAVKNFWTLQNDSRVTKC